MAIVKMKKLRLMAVRSEKDALLREMEREGCIEFSELDDSLIEAGLYRENGDSVGLRNLYSILQNAISLLDKYSPEKKPLLSAKPEVELDTLLDDTGIDDARKKAEFINGLEEKIKRLTAEENRQNALIESVKPWLDLDLPLNTAATERSSILWGSLPARVELAEVKAALAETTEEAELFLVSGDKSTNYVLVVCIREALSAVQESLRPFGFTAISFNGENATAADADSAAREKLIILANEKEAVRQELVDQAPVREDLKLAADIVSAKIARADAEGKLMGLDSTIVMQGWIPAE